MNRDIHRGFYQSVTGLVNPHYTYLNSLRCTYILVDLTSYLITPITQNHGSSWVIPEA
jgi:hypothetical protein